MSELKAINLNSMGCYNINEPIYLKSEVDNVIAENDKKIAELEMKVARAQLVLRLNEPEALFSDLEIMGRLRHEIDVVARRERHQKFKRCLAMANFCFTKSLFLRYVLADRIQNGENYISANDWRINLYEKWCERLKKLAEKFKEE